MAWIGLRGTGAPYNSSKLLVIHMTGARALASGEVQWMQYQGQTLLWLTAFLAARYFC